MSDEVVKNILLTELLKALNDHGLDYIVDETGEPNTWSNQKAETVDILVHKNYKFGGVLCVSDVLTYSETASAYVYDKTTVNLHDPDLFDTVCRLCLEKVNT